MEERKRKNSEEKQNNTTKRAKIAQQLNDFEPILNQLMEFTKTSNFPGDTDLQTDYTGVTKEMHETGEIRFPPATLEEIDAAESLLHTKFPPSYRSFLLLSNGYPFFDWVVGGISPVGNVRWCKDIEDRPPLENFQEFENEKTEPNGEEDEAQGDEEDDYKKEGKLAYEFVKNSVLLSDEKHDADFILLCLGGTTYS
jgi:hypothetical protein